MIIHFHIVNNYIHYYWNLTKGDDDDDNNSNDDDDDVLFNLTNGENGFLRNKIKMSSYNILFLPDW